MLKTLIPSLIVAAACSANGASIHEGLLNYWTLDTDAADTAGSFVEATGATTNDGSVNGDTTFGAGLFGGAASLPGGAGNNITYLDGPGSDAAGADGGVANDIDRTGSDMTLSAWFNASAWDTGWQAIVAHGEGTDYRLARNRARSPIELAGVAGTSDFQPSTTFGVAPDGDGLWHHILITAVEGGDSTFWIDGVPEGTQGGASIQPSPDNANLLCIGCNPENGREFNGRIDDVAIWDRALSADEIGQIFDGGQAGLSLGAIPEPGAAMLLSFAGVLMVLRRRR